MKLTAPSRGDLMVIALVLVAVMAVIVEARFFTPHICDVLMQDRKEEELKILRADTPAGFNRLVTPAHPERRVMEMEIHLLRRVAGWVSLGLFTILVGALIFFLPPILAKLEQARLVKEREDREGLEREVEESRRRLKY